jgi:hypothetical protein
MYAQCCEYAHQIGCCDIWTARYAFLLKWLLQGLQYDLEIGKPYIDKVQPMTLMVCRNIRPDSSATDYDLTEILANPKPDIYNDSRWETITVMTNQPTVASNVIETILNAKTPAQRARATRLLNKYTQERVAQGYSEKGVRAAIQAHVTRRKETLEI